MQCFPEQFLDRVYKLRREKVYIKTGKLNQSFPVKMETVTFSDPFPKVFALGSWMPSALMRRLSTIRPRVLQTAFALFLAFFVF